MPGAEPFEIQARDGHRLGATLFRPASSNGRALQINAAAGVKQEYYGKFAAYLAERGSGKVAEQARNAGQQRVREQPHSGARGAALGQGENLPAGVAIEWARWCRDPDYLVGALGAKERYARFSAPLRLYWVADDPYAPLAAAEALLELYPRAPAELTRVMPRELGTERIGHFGFFREQFRDTLWRDAADWLERH